MLILLAIVSMALCQQCNDTHLQFLSEYSLGKQDELNRTFTRIAEKLPTLDNITFRVNDSATYHLTSIQPRFFYVDSKQRAEINGNDTIVIYGGTLDVMVEFNWSKSGDVQASGSGVAFGISQPCDFAKQLEVSEDGYLLQTLLQADNITFDAHPINISRITPPTISEQDHKRVNEMINGLINNTAVRVQLQIDINRYYELYLRNSLYDHRTIINQHFEYVWHDPITTKGNLTIPFQMNATFVDVQKAGITLLYKGMITGYPEWKCQFHAPHLPLNPKEFGGIQEFVSFDIYKNTLKYALDKGMLDTDLTRKNWQSRFFQFFTGDLYQVIPVVADKFLALDPVSGNCKAQPNVLQMIKGNHDSINVTLEYDCQLSINRSKISDFRVNLLMMVQGRAHAQHLDFHIVHSEFNVTFVDYMQFKVVNKDLAEHMVMHSLNRLMNEKVFGSGWPLYGRDYPHFIVEDNYTIVYDSSHIESGNVKLEEYHSEDDDEQWVVPVIEGKGIRMKRQ